MLPLGIPRSQIYNSTINVNFGVLPLGVTINSFELIRPGSFTHATDFDQRLVVLHFVQTGAASFTVSTPARADLAPPGWYMLFAVAVSGRPSLGYFIHLGTS